MNSQITTHARSLQNHLLDWVVYNRTLGELETRAEYFAKLFANYLPQNCDILDIGGGWGFYSEPLAKRGHHLTVLDVRKPKFQKAPLVIYDPENAFPFPDKSFEASLIVTVLHHVSDPRPILSEAKRVTRGVLILVEDLYHHPLGRWWTILRDQLYNFEFFGHPRGFRKREEWIELFESHGFSLIEEKKVYTWLSGMRILNGVFVFRVS